MTLDALNEAIVEAYRFIETAYRARVALEADERRRKEWQRWVADQRGERPEFVSVGPTNVAARRASMDLIRALSRMRK